MRSSLRFSVLLATLAAPLAAGCSTSAGADAGLDAPFVSDAGSDAAASDTGSAPDAVIDAGLDAAGPGDGGVSCLDLGHSAGERYPAGDACNFCECMADGTASCTERTCADSIGGCSYAGVGHAYGARFPSTDGCNECVCAASGLACTRRTTCAPSDEGAILLESANEACGDNPEFTPAQVLGRLPTRDFVAPFLYERTRDRYAEVLPDTNVRIRIVFDEGFMVCRIPMPTQPALDLQVTVEWITEDGAFDEGFPAYLRKNDFGFVDSWTLAATAPLGGLSGTYTPICSLDPGGYSFSVEVSPDGSASGQANRVCETDLPLVIGQFNRPAP